MRSTVSLLVLMITSSAISADAATTYYDGVSPQLTGVYEFGTFLPNHIGSTNQDSFAAPITGLREYIYDVNGTLHPETAGSFNLVVYSFSEAKDSVRLYPSQDHYGGGPIADDIAPEVMEYSVWGSNTGGSSQSEWVMLSNPTGWTYPTAGKPEYTFDGAAPAAVIYRGGSFEGGILNAYTQEYTFSNSYKYFGIRGSSIAMVANTADPELDTMVAFNRVDAPLVPEPASLIIWSVLGVAGVVAYRRRRNST